MYLSLYKYLTHTNTHLALRKALTELPADNKVPPSTPKQPKKIPNPEPWLFLDYLKNRRHLKFFFRYFDISDFYIGFGLNDDSY